jgi:riboflavin biosynthesis pyrimidine reductase
VRVSRLVPGPVEEVDLDGDALDAWLRKRYALPGDGWLRLNLISALGGQITGPSGSSNDLAAGIDRPLLKLLRSLSDVVLVGAASVRAEGYTIPRRAPLAVATVSGDLDGHVFPRGLEPGRLLVLCPPAAQERVRSSVGEAAEILTIDGDPMGHPELLTTALRDRGLGRIVCEGGGALASRLLAAGLVDEFCHSLAPVVVSPGAPLTVGDVPLTTGHLEGLLLDETERLYARWRFRSDAAGSAPAAASAAESPASHAATAPSQRPGS